LLKASVALEDEKIVEEYLLQLEQVKVSQSVAESARMKNTNFTEKTAVEQTVLSS